MHDLSWRDVAHGVNFVETVKYTCSPLKCSGLKKVFGTRLLFPACTLGPVPEAHFRGAFLHLRGAVGSVQRVRADAMYDGGPCCSSGRTCCNPGPLLEVA